MDIPKIVIEIIPHDQHRYSTVGDWFYQQDGTLVIRVSKLSDWRREMLIAVHELIEVLCCKQDGVEQQVVDDFDKTYESNRAEDNEEEPGDDTWAPYRKQHCMATGVERLLASIWGVDWKDYERELGELPEVEPK